MYSGNVVRVQDSHVDPLERGPPKRIHREEQHIGEMVAASKKRVLWRFTLGESDRKHEMVLIHSIISSKKVVQYDGRQMHFSSTAKSGDWAFSMVFFNGLNLKMEVRINEMESAHVPKYDLLIDQIPFRRWDVGRLKKHVTRTATYIQPDVPPGHAYGTHRWGPDGATPSNEPQLHRGSFVDSQGSHRIQSSLTGSSPVTDCAQSFGLQGTQTRPSFEHSNEGTRRCVGQQNEQQGSISVYQCGEKRSSLREQSAPLASNLGASNVQRSQASTLAAPKPTKQPEINLIDDFGPSVSVSAQSLIFDPLVSAKMLSTRHLAATNASPQQQRQEQQQQHHSPSLAAGPQTATYVDPFASVATPNAAKPVGRINFDPYANSNAGTNYQQCHQQRTRQMPAGTTMHVGTFNQVTGAQQPMLGMPMNAPMGRFALQQQSVVRGSFVRQEPALAGIINVNFSISQLMNPASLQNSQSQQGKSINIDAFAESSH